VSEAFAEAAQPEGIKVVVEVPTVEETHAVEIFINPDPAATVALWEALRPHSVRHYRHIGHCLDEEYM